MYSNGLPGIQITISRDVVRFELRRSIRIHRWRTSLRTTANVGDPRIRTAAAILELELLRTSNSNGAAGIQVAENVGFEH